MRIKIFLKKYYPYLLIIGVILIFLFRPSFIDKSDYFLKPYWQNNPEPDNHLLPLKEAEISNILVFGGDIMLSRTVNKKMDLYGDYSWPLKNISSLFSEADLAVANLESPFLVTNNYEVNTGSFSFKANPRSVEGLKLAGFDVLSLANNHILNQGRQGIADTYKVLDEASIDSVGTKERKLLIKESKGVRFAFLAYSYDSSSDLIPSLDIRQAKADIEEAEKKADAVIILMHAGIEYQRQPNAQQITFAHAAIDAGADLVIGHHPHWPQIVEEYSGKTIIYSLGNLVFDQMWSKETSEGLVVKVHFKDKILDHIEYVPIQIKDYGQAILMPAGNDFDKLIHNLNIKN